MKGLEIILLYMIEKVQGERSLAGCYHILTGKRSGQAIQDAALFGFQGWYGTFQRMPLSTYESTIDQLLKERLITRDGDRCRLTAEGERVLKDRRETYQFDSRAFLVTNPSVRTKDIQRFWSRLQLAVQVCSFYLAGQNGYDPVVLDFQSQQWVKRLWRAEKDKKTFITSLYSDLNAYFQQAPDPLIPHFILDRLSGYRQPGWTLEQLAERYALPQAVTELFWHQILLHGLTYILMEKPPTLTRFVQGITHSLPITESAYQTYQLFVQGRTLEAIARERQLKRSTIEDHLVEIAIHDDHFPWERFLSAEQLAHILRASEQYQTKKAAVLKRIVGESVTFFQIRLALVKGEFHGTT